MSGIPGLAVGLLMLVSLKEPERNQNQLELSGTACQRLGRTLKNFCSPSLLLICLAGSIRNACEFYFLYLVYAATYRLILVELLNEVKCVLCMQYVASQYFVHVLC